MNRAGKYRLNRFFSSWRGLSCNNDSNTCHGLRPYIRTRIFRNRRNHCDCKREKGCNRSPIRKNKPLRFSPVLFRIRVLFLYRRSHETLRPFVRLVSRSLPYIRLQRLEEKVFFANEGNRCLVCILQEFPLSRQLYKQALRYLRRDGRCLR